MNLEIFFTRTAIKELSQIDKKDALIIKDKILLLSNNPSPKGYKKLEG